MTMARQFGKEIRLGGGNFTRVIDRPRILKMSLPCHAQCHSILSRRQDLCITAGTAPEDTLAARTAVISW